MISSARRVDAQQLTDKGGLESGEVGHIRLGHVIDRLYTD
jgi:hypothetical protein